MFRFLKKKEVKKEVVQVVRRDRFIGLPIRGEFEINNKIYTGVYYRKSRKFLTEEGLTDIPKDVYVRDLKRFTELNSEIERYIRFIDQEALYKCPTFNLIEEEYETVRAM